ncbi:transposase [Nonomuraea sp. NPDC000554]|uniref:transposase n=1 Tax=Nonomuraea sp. NPDC000554 TaxID=3154259 RepID=UPI003324A38D
MRAAAGVPATTTGKDAAQKVPGRKRGLAVDVLGLVIAVVVAAASIHDNAIGAEPLDRVAAATMPGSVQTALVDQGFKTSVAAHGATHGIDAPRSGSSRSPRSGWRPCSLHAHGREPRSTCRARRMLTAPLFMCSTVTLTVSVLKLLCFCI